MNPLIARTAAEFLVRLPDHAVRFALVLASLALLGVQIPASTRAALALLAGAGLLAVSLAAAIDPNRPTYRVVRPRGTP
jgi:hypothetical protein